MSKKLKSKKTIKTTTLKTKECPECFGHGSVQDGGTFSRFFKCDVCNGKGIIYE